MFSKFSEEAQKSLLLAKNEMMKLNHPYVGSEHLLLAILSTNNYISRYLKKYNITYKMFYNEIIKIIGKGSKPTTWYLYTPLLKKVIQNASLDSREKHLKEVTLEQLFISLLEEGDGVAIRLLIGMNIDIDLIYEEFSSKFLVKKNKVDNNLLINDFSINFNKCVLNGEIDPVIDRDIEVNRLIEILSRRTKNNPLLIGEAGVGKTAIVEELSRRIVEGKVPKFLCNKKVLSVSISSLVSGTKYRGEFEERINKMLKEIESNQNIIIFIDEIHTIVGAGGAEGAIDASNILKPSLARGKIRIIGATTYDEYKKYIEKDRALDRRFQKIFVLEPDKEKTKNMLRSLKPIYESYHGVSISNDVLDYIVEMADKYIQNRKNPDKSIDILDEVCVKASIKNSEEEVILYEKNNKIKKIVKEKNKAVQNGNFIKANKLRVEQNNLETEINNVISKNSIKNKSTSITKNMVNKVIEIKTQIPIYEINKNNKLMIKKLEINLKNNIYGQDSIIDTVIKYTKKIQLGFRKNRPYSFLFVGPTGVGKTMLVKKYAEILYGKDNFIRLDMSEYKEESSISKLIGSAPGYVGYDDNVMIFDKVRNHPNSVILLDEIEKASPSVIKLFLQILDEGIIRDSSGRNIYFNNSIVFMTSNLGCTGGSIGFNNIDNISNNLKEFFSIEFLNRIDKICIFNNLESSIIHDVIKKRLKALKKKYKEKGYNIKISNDIVENISIKSKYNEYGARKIDKVIEEDIESKIIDEIIDNKKEIKV